jgi:hypothetical protein
MPATLVQPGAAQALQPEARTGVAVRGAPALVLSAGSIGSLVPVSRRAGHVHSVFTRACNIACGDRIVFSLVTHPEGAGPATLVLAHARALDLRRLFEPGEPIELHGAVLRARRAIVRCAVGARWRPRARRALLPPARIEANLDCARERLALARTHSAGLFDAPMAMSASQLLQATRTLDAARAERGAAQLVGLGEGLTPAGDDFLVGWLAALHRGARDAARRRFVATMGGAVDRLAAGTTPIAGHYLRLAARGHFVAAVDTVREALLCEPQGERMEQALATALGMGATSGADTVSGLLSGLAAWMPPGDAA